MKLVMLHRQADVNADAVLSAYQPHPYHNGVQAIFDADDGVEAWAFNPIVAVYEGMSKPSAQYVDIAYAHVIPTVAVLNDMVNNECFLQLNQTASSWRTAEEAWRTSLLQHQIYMLYEQDGEFV